MRETLDRLETAVAAVVYRIKQLESNARQTFPECYQAQAIASELGINPKVVCQRGLGSGRDRARLIRELRARKWSLPRIARALGCCERTIERATKERKP